MPAISNGMLPATTCGLLARSDVSNCVVTVPRTLGALSNESTFVVTVYRVVPGQFGTGTFTLNPRLDVGDIETTPDGSTIVDVCAQPSYGFPDVTVYWMVNVACPIGLVI